MQSMKSALSRANATNVKCDLRWRTKSGLVVPTLSLALCGGVVRAQDASSQSLTSEVATNTSSSLQNENRQETNAYTGICSGSSSDTVQVPAHFRPFLLTLPQDHLLGDWAGLLP